jgi:branched-chain amino acid transport system permease protein
MARGCLPRRHDSQVGATELLQFALAGLKNGSIYALVALGFTLVYAATGVINFAQGEFYMLGGMLSVWAYADLGLPLLLAGLVGVAATALVGGLFELLAIRPRKDGDPLALIVITVGGSMVLSSLARHLFGPLERALPLFSGGGKCRVVRRGPGSADDLDPGNHDRDRGRAVVSVQPHSARPSYEGVRH